MNTKGVVNFILFLSLFSLTMAQAQTQTQTQTQKRSRLRAQAQAKKHKKKQKKEETVNDLLQAVAASRGSNHLTIQKKNAALPEVQRQGPAPVPLTQIKPPRSSEFVHDANTDEEKLEEVTDEGINELYQLTQKYSKSPNRGELWLRLAELYVEKAKFIEYRLQKVFDDKLAIYFKNGSRGPKPIINLSRSREYNEKAVKLYEFYLHDFPTSPKIDQALFFLGYNYVELDNIKRGIAFYQKLTKEHPRSPYVAEAYFALGEFYFDNDKWSDALKSYTEILKNPRARLYTFALYKIAWCEYRLSRAGEGLKTLEKVISLSRHGGETDSGQGRRPISKIKLGSEALKDIVLFYSDVGNYQSARDYFLQIGGEKAQYIMLEKLAYLYSDSGRKDEAIYTFRQLMGYNPIAPKAFDYQYQIVSNLQSSKNQSVYRNELYSWIDSFGPDSDWAKANKNDKKLIDDSYRQRESALRNYVLLVHKNAQNSQRKADLGAVKLAYELYLTKFQDAPKANEMRFFYAELLYAMGFYPNAAKEYNYVAEKEPKGKYYELSVLNTLLALEKSLRSDEEIKKIVGSSLEPVPFGESEVAFLAAGDRYIKTFPRGDKAVDVKFKIGRLNYAFNHFDDAIKIFKQIIAESPRTQYAVYSANLILDIYNLRKDYTSLAREGQSFMRNHALTESGFQTDVRDLVQNASFKKAQDLEVQKDYKGSAKAYGDFYRSYPSSPLAQSAAFNAGVNYERSGDYADAIGFYAKTVATPSKKDDKLKKKASLLLAHLYEQTAQYEKAAVQFEKYAKENPKDKETPDLYFNAAVILEGEKKFYPAMNDYQKYYDKTHRRDRNHALFVIAKIQEKMGHLKAAQDGYEKYLNVGGGDPEEVVEATFKIGDLNERRGHHDEAEKGYRRTVAVEKRYAGEGKHVGLAWAAEAKFRLTQKTYNDFVSLRIPANPKRQAGVIKDKLALLTRLSSELATVIKYDEGDMVIASLTTLGQAYAHMSRAIWKAPLPKDLNAQELEAYKKGVDGVAKPLEDQAIQNYTAAINKSYEINSYNKWTQTSLDAMAQYQPDKFFVPNESVIPSVRTDDGMDTL